MLCAASPSGRIGGGSAGLIDRDVLAAGGFFLAIVMVAPDKFMNTIFFGSRWLPVAMIFILLSLPAPSIRRLSARTVALALAAAFFLMTTIAWHLYRTKDLAGFRESLDRLPASSRVLGLDLIKESDIVKGRPFLQLFAYAQVFKGSELNFSFAEHYSGLGRIQSQKKCLLDARTGVVRGEGQENRLRLF